MGSVSIWDCGGVGCSDSMNQYIPARVVEEAKREALFIKFKYLINNSFQRRNEEIGIK